MRTVLIGVGVVLVLLGLVAMAAIGFAAGICWGLGPGLAVAALVGSVVACGLADLFAWTADTLAEKGGGR